MIAGQIEIQLLANVARLQRDMDRGSQIISSATAQMTRAANAVKTALGSIASGLGGRELIRMSDEYAKFTAQIKLATQSQREYAAAYADVKRISTQSTQGLGETGVLYARIANGTRELGVAQKQVAAITETVNLSLMVSGATASEAASAQLQLSQAFASGTLRGEEFNAVNEAAPRLMLALADGIGVPVGALKKMAEEGQITSGIMADVLPNALAKLREEAKEVQTIGGAFTVLKNSVMEFTGVQAQSSGAVAALTGAISGLASNLDALAKVGMVVAAVYGSRMVASLVATASAKMDDIIASRAQARANEEAAAAALRRAQAERQTALITQSKARENTALVRAEVVADQQRVASAVMAAEQQIVARQGQFAATAAIVRQEIALEQTRLAAQINSIGRAQRTAELARLATQLAAIEKGMAAQSAALAAQRIAGEQAVANAAAAGAARIAAAREAEVIATGAAAAATLRMRAANAALTAAMGATAVASRVLTGALALVGGPIGLVTLAIMGGITAWTMWGNKAEEANDKALQSTEETTPEMIARLDKQIEKLKERNALAEAEPRIKSLGQMSDVDMAGLARAKAALDAVRSGTGEWANQSATMRQLAEIDILANYETALKRVQQVQDEVTKAAARTRNERLADWYAQNGSNAQKMTAELDKLKKEFGAIPPEMEKMVRAKYADKGAAAAIKQEATAYQNLVTSIREKIGANQLELSGYDKLTESQKATIKLDAEISTGKNKLSDGSIKQARAEIERLEVQEQALEFQKLRAKATEAETKADSDHYDKLRASTSAVEERIVQMQREIDLHGLSAAAAVEAEKAKLEAKLALGPATHAELVALDQQIEKLGQLADLVRKKEVLDASKKAADQIVEDQKRIWGDIERTAHDTFISIFDSGKSAFDRLKDALRNGLYELLYQMTVKKWIVNVQTSSSGGSLMQTLTSSGSGGSSILGTASNLFEAGKSIFGGFKTGLSSYLGQGLSYVGNAVNSNAMFSFGQGMQGFGAGGVGSGISGGAASAGGSFSSVLGVSGWVAAGMALADGLFKKGFTDPSTIQKKDMLHPLVGESLLFNKVFQALGMSGKTANLLSGASIATALFGRKAPEVESQGIQGSFGGSGFSGEAYANILEKGGVFRSDKRYVKTGALSADQDASFDATYKAMVDAAKGFASMLGIEAGVIDGYNKQIKLQLGADEAKNQEAIAKLFGEIGDELSLRLVPNLAGFALAGETTSATLQRLVTDYVTVDEALTAIGMQFGAVGVASLSARERLVAASGGLEAFSANTAGFQQNFLTEAERNAPVLKAVTEQLAALGLAGVDTRDEFKQVVQGLDLTTEAGAKQYGQLIGMQAAFAQVYPALEKTVDAAAEAAAKLAEVNKPYLEQIAELERSLMSANDRRLAEIAGMDASTVALYDHVAGLRLEIEARDKAASRAQEVAAEAKSLQDRFDAMTMSTQQLRDKELDQLDASNQAILRNIFAIEDSKAALNAETEARNNAVQAARDRGADALSGLDSMFSVLQSVVNREKALLQESATAHRSLSSALHGTLDSMHAVGDDQGDRMGAQAQIRAALAIARAGGALPDADSLKGALSAVSKDASSMFATQQDYLRDFYATQNDIAALAGLSDQALSAEELQLQRLDGILSSAQQQIDALKGIDTSIFSLAEALGGFDRAIEAVKADPVASAGGELSKLYKELLGRQVDSVGMKFYTDRMADGVTLAQIREAIKQSEEYKKFKGVPGFDAGGAHEGGWRVVGENNWELEHTGPSRVISNSDSKRMLDNRQVVDAIKELQAAVFPVLYQSAKNAGRAANSLENMDRVGVEMREEVN